MNNISNMSALIVIAHPDDEAMFFGPAIKYLTKEKRSNTVTLLCFSQGDDEGLGKVRVKELKDSCERFGIKSFEVIDSDKFIDGMKSQWKPGDIREVLHEYIKRWKIEVIFTFDGKGVSGHPNHISIAKGTNTMGIPTFQLLSQPALIKYTILYPPSKGADLVCSNTWLEMIDCQLSMPACHKSQMRWFRWGWICFSRYMAVNEFIKV